MSRFFFAMGYRTREAAQAMLEDLFADGQISEGEHPEIKSYKRLIKSEDLGKLVVQRWGIEIDG